MVCDVGTTAISKAQGHEYTLRNAYTQRGIIYKKQNNDEKALLDFEQGIFYILYTLIFNM